ncbi:hypothetical protein [Pontimonas salivibrio]|uniref:hypothetical protein n=1 Tax=Pontimonas salivibrio TaxID=1159327 RepID=UPI001319FC25|nr:hypothetical protein [Pontimonas salivibrio]
MDSSVEGDQQVDEAAQSADELPADKLEARSDSVETAEELGSRENPLPIGTAVVLDDGMGGVWEVTLLAPDLEANEVVLAENMFNEDPPEGFQYSLLPVVAKYLGEETGTAAWDLDFAYVSAAGTTHKPFDVSVVIPDDLGSLNELYNGGVAEGNIAIAIPSEAPKQGTWRIGTSWGDAAVFFAAQ